jgi:hypothetical protein
MAAKALSQVCRVLASIYQTSQSRCHTYSKAIMGNLRKRVLLCDALTHAKLNSPTVSCHRKMHPTNTINGRVDKGNVKIESQTHNRSNNVGETGFTCKSRGYSTGAGRIGHRDYLLGVRHRRCDIRQEPIDLVGKPPKKASSGRSY